MSRLFDSEWYLTKYPDVDAEVKRTKGDALTHYAEHGAKEGRSPHPLFDAAWYLERYPDVAAEVERSGGDAVTHYLKHGGREHRSPHPLFHPAWYLEQLANPQAEIERTDGDALAHYLAYGAREGRSPHPLFNPASYTSRHLSKNGKPTASYFDVLTHHLKFGARTGHDICPHEDAAWFLADHPDVGLDFINVGKDRSYKALYSILTQDLLSRVAFHPGELFGIRQRIVGDDTIYECLGDDPQMQIGPAYGLGSYTLPPGSYRIEFTADAIEGQLANPAIYLDTGNGIAENFESKYYFGQVAPNRWATDFVIGAKAKSIRFDPSEGRCTFGNLSIAVTKSPAGRANAGGATLGHSSLIHRDAYDVSVATANGARSPAYAPLREIPVGLRGDEPLVVAFYLPQFHPIAENDKWWGRGFTEWTNVSKTIPQYKGHYQPRLPGELGFYDLRLPEVMARQIELAKTYGLNGFCFHYYWFAGHRLLERPIEQFLADKSAEFQFPFCLCWANENWTRRWDGDETDVLMKQEHSDEDNVAVFGDLMRYMLDDRYIRVDGKPVLVLYRPAIIPNILAMVASWREEARKAGLPGIHLVASNAFGFDDVESIGFDAICEFPPHNVVATETRADFELLNMSYSGLIYSYEDVIDYSLARLKQKEDLSYCYYPTVMAGWDNSARKPGRGNVFHGATPDLFAGWLRGTVDWAGKNKSRSNLVFVNAWNEWGEGTYLEPDREFGYAYLSAVSAVREDLYVMPEDLTERFARRAPHAKRTSDFVICVHLYYSDLIDEIAEHVANIRKTLAVDVLLTVPESWDRQSFTQAEARIRPIRILPVKNRGRDVLPFLRALQVAREMGYSWGCKLHGKKSKHLSAGASWRTSLISRITEPAFVNAVTQAASAGDRTGIVMAKESVHSIENPDVMRDNWTQVRRILKAIGNETAPLQDFAAGTMFWFKLSALTNILDLKFDEADFGAELGSIDGTLAHAFERLFPTIVAEAGYEALVIGEAGSITPY